MTITGPDIAENGAVVPVAVAAALPDVKRMLVLVEKNPAVMAAIFDVSDAVDRNFSTRVKMAQSSNVYAVVMMGDGRVLFAQKEIKVTLAAAAIDATFAQQSTWQTRRASAPRPLATRPSCVC